MATAQVGTLLRYIHKLAAGHGSSQRTDRQLLDDFSTRRDEAAFAALVARHGPMVLRVCRRLLNHEQDAEDAFQATFLVLARNTGSIRKREALANWLHGVAHRTAMELKRKAARRRNHEARLGARRTDCQSVPPTWDDVQAVLDEEIQRLPQAFRAAFVLCVLEGKSVPEAAAELVVKQGTVSSRLTRARQRLRQQLARRGIELSALLAAMSVAESAGKAAVPALLANATLRFGLLVAAGRTAAGVIPSQVAALAAGVTRAMLLTKAKIAVVVLCALGLVAAAGALTHKLLVAGEKETPASAVKKSNTPGPQASAKAKTPEEVSDAIVYAGRVLDPDGRPVAGAKLGVSLYYGFPHPLEQFPLDATTGADGRFKFTAPKGKYPGEVISVGAMAANYGAGWVNISEDGKEDDLTLRLVKDDVPIIGQIVGLEGKPVPGATVRLLEIRTGPGEDLSPWLEAVKAKKGSGRLPEWEYLTQDTIAVPAKATTAADGRFRLKGIGRNRLVRVQLDGPTIASQVLQILTQPGAATEVARQEGNPDYNTPRIVTTYYGPNFRHPAAPTKPVVGVVRDKDTNQPLAGVTIQSMSIANSPDFHPMERVLWTTTDAQGRYCLTGMPKGKGNTIGVVPPRDLPYVAVTSEVPDTDGLDPVTVDIELKRGVWIEGKITDKATGKPVQARVEYFAKADNPNLRDYPGFENTFSPLGIVAAKVDGSYRVAALRGPGLVVVWRKGHYVPAPDRDDEYGNKESPLDVIPFPLPTGNYCAVAPIDLAKGVVSVKRDVTLDLGWAFKVTVLGPDGKPLVGARIFDLGWAGEVMKTAEFTVRRFNPRRPRDVLVQHLDMGLVAEVQPPKKNGGSVIVKMQPGAAVTGRLIDADGQPRAGVALTLDFSTQGPTFSDTKTDRQGRFRFGALLPKYKYQLSDRQGTLPVGGLRPGQTKDLGDVHLKPGGQ